MIILNKNQENAVKSNDISLLIIAGAGTGKTKVLVEKIIHLIKGGVSGKNILALTFTNKASDEMKERISISCSSADMPFIGTFHSFCVTLLREFYKSAGVEQNFSIFDRDETKKIIKRCMKNEGIEEPTPRIMQSHISKLKTGLYTEEQNSKIEKTEKILSLYVETMKKENAIDFDDIIIKTVSLLKRNPEIQKSIQERYKYILIDEYQDTDAIQNHFISLLHKKDTHIIAVGDTDQTIYSWRGASVHNMLSFKETYKPSKIVMLTQNYRSTANILNAANNIIQKNILRQDKSLIATKNKGEHITILKTYDEEDEAKNIAKKIKEAYKNGIEYSDMAILFRANFQARSLESHMLLNHIPYTVLGARFFDRIEIKGLVSYITLIINPESKEALTRATKIPKRGIGATTLQRIFNGEEHLLSTASSKKIKKFREDIHSMQKIANTHNIADVLKEIIQVIDYKSYIKNTFDNANDRLREVGELVSFANRFSNVSGTEGAKKLLEEIALGSDQDTLRTNSGKGVRLMTVHAAKGLEFSHVFLSGMEEGLFPFIQDEFEQHDTEEERRLCYVAITRAKNKLYCSYAKRRGFFGIHKPMQISSFLLDIPENITLTENTVWRDGKIKDDNLLDSIKW